MYPKVCFNGGNVDLLLKAMGADRLPQVGDTIGADVVLRVCEVSDGPYGRRVEAELVEMGDVEDMGESTGPAEDKSEGEDGESEDKPIMNAKSKSQGY
jgi:hypothetical protein